MKTFTLVSAVSALMIAGTVAYAQPTPPAGGGDGPGRRAPMDRADLESLTDARIAAIQAGLKLTSEQQSLWAPVEQALRANASERVERMEERRDHDRDAARPDFMQRMEQRSEFVSRSATRATALTDALQPLWASLDERQKRLLPVLMRTEGPRWGRGGRGHHGMKHAMRHGGMRDGMGGMRDGMRGGMRDGMGGMRGPRGGTDGDQDQDAPTAPTPAPQPQ